MLDLKLLKGSLDGVIESGAYSRYYMHRTGHWLGLDVHDVGDYRQPGPAQGGERPWRALQAGMMLTIEPGIYVRPPTTCPRPTGTSASASRMTRWSRTRAAN